LTEFERGVRRVSYMLISFMLLMVPLVLIISGLVSKDWGEAALFCISVAVGITPEMLPMIINANLCHAALKLAKLKVIVKRLDSVQTLGAMDVLCSDKTGTLTKDDIILHSAIDSSNNPSQVTLRHAFLNASLQEGLQNAIDSAIVHYAETHLGLEVLQKIKQDFEKVAELPFDFDRRLLSIFVHNVSDNVSDAGAATIITKGAAEEVLAKCTHVHWDGEVVPLTLERKLHLEKICTSMNEQGMRTVGVATRNLTLDNGKSVTTADEMDLEFEGFLAFLDPPKDDAAEAVEELRRLGVAVKVLTGDNTAAAKAVASKIGLMNGDSEADNLVISGPELSNLDVKGFQEAVERCMLFTKLKPLQKQDIVRALMQRGHSVGFLGDGINDAAALRSSDVGISVDTATSVAKHAANIILLQKSLKHVINGVIYGRITHGNTIKYIKMAASSNFGNIFSVTIAAAWLPFVPMAPLQLLIQNLMYDISQSAIPWDHVDPEMTAGPRQWKVWSIVRFMIWMGPTSSIFDIGTFLLGWYPCLVILLTS
jgi:P-type Mg2+ transporter